MKFSGIKILENGENVNAKDRWERLKLELTKKKINVNRK